MRRPRRSTLFPYTTLFRSLDRKARARLIQPVFQDPFASLNPRRRIKDIVALPLTAQGTFSRAEVERRVGGILERVGLSARSEEHTSELQSRVDLVCRLLLE